MSANLSAVFNQQFLAPAVLGIAKVAANYTLLTYLSGTTTPQATFTDPAGSVPNANPIVLDADGRCTMYLSPAVLYTLVLKDTLGATVRTWNNVGAAALTTGTVVSINGLTGIVALDASGIPYVTSSGAVWLTADNVESALDQIAAYANAPSASSVSVTPIAGLSATNVQAAFAELAVRAPGSVLRITSILNSGTWTKGSDVGSIMVELVGGGASPGPATYAYTVGGGAGGYCRKLITAPAASYAAVIGAGGSSAGGAGGNTTFDTMVGGGGAANGAGGTAVGGDVNITGGPGAFPSARDGSNATPGVGGSSFFGGGARSAGENAANGVSATPNTGGGATGGSATAGVGGSGLIVVTEYSK